MKHYLIKSIFCILITLFQNSNLRATLDCSLSCTSKSYQHQMTSQDHNETIFCEEIKKTLDFFGSQADKIKISKTLHNRKTNKTTIDFELTIERIHILRHFKKLYKTKCSDPFLLKENNFNLKVFNNGLVIAYLKIKNNSLYLKGHLKSSIYFFTDSNRKIWIHKKEVEEVFLEPQKERLIISCFMIDTQIANQVRSVDVKLHCFNLGTGNKLFNLLLGYS